MTLAQRLYESGKITYMRTDSTNISDEARSNIKKYVIEKFGEKIPHTKKFFKKIKKCSRGT